MGKGQQRGAECDVRVVQTDRQVYAWQGGVQRTCGDVEVWWQSFDGGVQRRGCRQPEECARACTHMQLHGAGVMGAHVLDRMGCWI